MLKATAARLSALGAVTGLVALAERLDRGAPNVLRVLTYHRVDHAAARPDLNPRLISATPEAFAAQMAWLAQRHAVVTLGAVIEACAGGPPLPPRAVLLTFDDATQDFGFHAWPILKSLGLPAVVFVPTAFPDRPERAFWWDRIHRALNHAGTRAAIETPIGRLPLTTTRDRDRAYLRLSREVKARPHAAAMALVEAVCAGAPRPAPAVLGWDALRKLAGEGVALAPHTRSHPLLSRVAPDVAWAEVVGSRDDLKRAIGTSPAAFAYPDGAHTRVTVEILRRAGFAAAFTTRRGVNRLGRADPLRLERINVGRRVTPAIFRARLVAWPRPFERAGAVATA